MDSLTHLAIPETKTGQRLRAFMEAQCSDNFALLEDCFSDDIVFNGRLYKASGRENVLKMYKDFMGTFLASLRIEAIAPAANNQWIVAEFYRLKGREDQEDVVVDLLKFDSDEKICRIDNCFKTDKIPTEVLEDAAAQK